MEDLNGLEQTAAVLETHGITAAEVLAPYMMTESEAREAALRNPDYAGLFNGIADQAAANGGKACV